jgi:uncharacterized protein (TIGR00725 family)
MLEQLPIVGVMGSGSQPWTERAEPLGRWLAQLGVHLLTGGGGGVMEAVSRAFCAVDGRRGRALGVLPAEPGRPGRAPDGYPNPWVEIAIRTHLELRGSRGAEAGSRNHLHALSSDVLIALPGGPGTASEVELALRYGRPVAAFVAQPGELPGLAPSVPRLAALRDVQGFVREVLGWRLP